MLQLKIINFTLGTFEALLFIKIKIVREKARNTCIIIPEIVILTLANFLFFVVYLTKRTSLTIFSCSTVVRRIDTASTLETIKVRCLTWTVYTLFGCSIINLLILTIHAFESREVKVFRNIALDTIGPIPVEICWASTTFFNNNHSSFASLTITSVWVPNRLLGTFITFLTIEIRSFFGTRYTFFKCYIVYFIICAYLT